MWTSSIFVLPRFDKVSRLLPDQATKNVLTLEPDMNRQMADVVVVIHLLFVMFVVAGGFLLVRWPKLAWLQIPAAAWGAYIEFSGRICPLTPLENRLRGLGGGVTYRGDFVEHYLLPILYPANLTLPIQMLLGGVVIGVNAVAYAWAYQAWRRRRGK